MEDNKPSSSSSAKPSRSREGRSSDYNIDRKETLTGKNERNRNIFHDDKLEAESHSRSSQTKTEISKKRHDEKDVRNDDGGQQCRHSRRQSKDDVQRTTSKMNDKNSATPPTRRGDNVRRTSGINDKNNVTTTTRRRDNVRRTSEINDKNNVTPPTTTRRGDKVKKKASEQIEEEEESFEHFMKKENRVLKRRKSEPKWEYVEDDISDFVVSPDEKLIYDTSEEERRKKMTKKKTKSTSRSSGRKGEQQEKEEDDDDDDENVKKPRWKLRKRSQNRSRRISKDDEDSEMSEEEGGKWRKNVCSSSRGPTKPQLGFNDLLQRGERKMKRWKERAKQYRKVI